MAFWLWLAVWIIFHSPIAMFNHQRIDLANTSPQTMTWWFVWRGVDFPVMFDDTGGFRPCFTVPNNFVWWVSQLETSINSGLFFKLIDFLCLFPYFSMYFHMFPIFLLLSHVFTKSPWKNRARQSPYSQPPLPTVGECPFDLVKLGRCLRIAVTRLCSYCFNGPFVVSCPI